MTKPQYTTHSIYRITCIANGLMYIGQASDYKTRKSAHLSFLKDNQHHNKHIQRAYNKYGRDAFIFDVIQVDLSIGIIDAMEVYWIAYYDTFLNGFNQTPGGDGVGGLGVACVWNGITYTSVASAARANGIRRDTMAFRLRVGYEKDSDVPMHFKECVWNGVTYKSISEAAKANNLSIHKMQSRIRNGQTKDEDVNVKYRDGVGCTWNGIQYPSISAAARANNLNFDTLWLRLKRGHTCDDDVRTSE